MCQSQGKVVCLRARVDKEGNAKVARQRGRQPLCIVRQVVMEEPGNVYRAYVTTLFEIPMSPGVCVQLSHLVLTSFDHRWVAVANVADIVDAVKVGVVVVVVHVLPLGSHNLQGVLLEEELTGWADVLLPQSSRPVPAGHWDLPKVTVLV